MALPLPNLDDRRFTDLVEEGRALIPRHAPGWTDHNAHDPGITLLELFAWLAEQGVYRLNHVSERHRLKFLRLVGHPPRPPRAAVTVVALRPEDGVPVFDVPRGALFDGRRPGGAAVAFRSGRALRVQPARLRAVLVDAGDGVRRDVTADLREGGTVEAFGPAPAAGATLHLGFEGLVPGEPLSLAVCMEGPGTDAEARRLLLEEAAAQRAECAPVVPAIKCPDAGPDGPAAPEVPVHHSVRLAWEVLTGASPEAWSSLEAILHDAPPTAGQVRDDTRAFTLDGTLEVNVPLSAVPAALAPMPAPLFYVRARLVTGGWDAPPALTSLAPNGAWSEQVVPAAQTFAIDPAVVPVGSAQPGETTRLLMQLDAAGVVQSLEFDPGEAALPAVRVFEYVPPSGGSAGRLTLDLVLAERGTGRPGQEVTIAPAPVAPESVRVFTHDGQDWHAWEARADLDAARRGDRHVALDPSGGRVRGGDGERGRVFPEGVPILIAADHTQGADGNVPAATLDRPASAPPNAAWLDALPQIVREALPQIVSQPVVARGGAGRETVGEAGRRAAEALHAHERLVHLADDGRSVTLDQLDAAAVRSARAPARALNLLDFERLALGAPGTRVARARAWAGRFPGLPCSTGAGMVTVVVVPDMPVPRPRPSAGLLRAVRAYLGRRRVVCTRVEVVGPDYVEVAVHARLRRRPHRDPGRIAQDVRRALDAFLDPRRGGPAGRGWPFGRDVYRSEILQVIDGVVGVDHVEELFLVADGEAPVCGNVPLCPTALAAPGAHRITVSGEPRP